MAKMSKNMIMGIILLISLVLMYIPIPLINEKIIAQIAILAVALYMMFVK